MQELQEYAKRIAYLLSEKYLQGKTSGCILKLCREIGQSLKESLRGVKHVKNSEIFELKALD